VRVLERSEVLVEFSLGLGTEVLRRTPLVLRVALLDLPSAWTEADEGPGTWSPYQVLGHLLHVEECDWMDRTRLLLADEADAVFEPIDREAGFTRFAGATLGTLLDRFAAQRAANMVELDRLVTDEELGRTGTHPDFGVVTLRELLATWVVHDLNHLGQIVTTMAKQYREAVGPWRAYLPIVDRA
jgi:uncharacterized damage-inducible protein DinB